VPPFCPPVTTQVGPDEVPAISARKAPQALLEQIVILRQLPCGSVCRSPSEQLRKQWKDGLKRHAAPACKLPQDVGPSAPCSCCGWIGLFSPVLTRMRRCRRALAIESSGLTRDSLGTSLPEHLEQRLSSPSPPEPPDRLTILKQTIEQAHALLLSPGRHSTNTPK